MSALLALVANLLAAGRLLGAVAGVVAGLAAVVALHAVNTFAYSLVSYTLPLPTMSSSFGYLRDMWPKPPQE